MNRGLQVLSTNVRICRRPRSHFFVALHQNSSLRVSRQELDHYRVDPLDALILCHAHAVVAILNEVETANLVQSNRRQSLVATERSIYPLPPPGHTRLYRHEVTIEISVAIYTAHYLRHLNDPLTQITPMMCPVRLPDLVEYLQLVALSP
jgi:hypothetical protein